MSNDRVFISLLEPRCPLGQALDIRQRHPVYRTASGDKARHNQWGIISTKSSRGLGRG